MSASPAIVFYGDDFEHGHLRQSAHPVIRSLLAVDQTFLGHVLEQCLEGDLLVTLEPEGLGDLALATGAVGGLDEL